VAATSPPVVASNLVLDDTHEVEVDLALLVLVHSRLNNRSAVGALISDSAINTRVQLF